jgi:hypothetical protein
MTVRRWLCQKILFTLKYHYHLACLFINKERLSKKDLILHAQSSTIKTYATN